MKTTVELSDAVLKRARRVAARDGVTLRALMEEGLRRVVAERDKGPRAFTLRDASYGGRGASPEFGDGGWDAVRDEIYRGHGA